MLRHKCWTLAVRIRSVTQMKKEQTVKPAEYADSTTDTQMTGIDFCKEMSNVGLFVRPHIATCCMPYSNLLYKDAFCP